GLLELVVVLCDRRCSLAKQCLLLRSGEEAGCRLIAGFLPAEDHFARARPEDAIEALRVEAERRQRHLQSLTVELRQFQRGLGSLRRLLGRRFGVGLLLGVSVSLLLGLRIGLPL